MQSERRRLLSTRDNISRRIHITISIALIFVAASILTTLSARRIDKINESLSINSVSKMNTIAVLTYRDFVAVPAIARWLHEEIGISVRTADQSVLGLYVPLRVVIKENEKLRTKDAFHAGHVALNLIHEVSGSSGIPHVSSLMIVVEYATGSLLRALPLFSSHVGITGVGVGTTRVLGLKVHSVDELLLSTKAGGSMSGPMYLWRWREEKMLHLVAGGANDDPHDVQLSIDGSSVWRINANESGMISRELETGDIVKLIPGDKRLFGAGTNHAQLIENDTKAIISNKDHNSFGCIDIEGRILWIVNGSQTNLFMGQHNVEYFGNDEYYMMDNECLYSGFEGGVRPSRLLVLRLNKQNQPSVAWDYIFTDDLPTGYMTNFGDHDRLPSGNSLASFWPGDISSNFYDGAELLALEILPLTKDVVWSLQVYGILSTNCYSAHCTRDGSNRGWKAYAIERFYDAPPIWGIHCTKQGNLTFNSVSPFKSSNPLYGYFEVIDTQGQTRAAGKLVWPEYWRWLVSNKLLQMAGPAEEHLMFELRVSDSTSATSVKQFTCD